LMMCSYKHMETRSWGTDYRGPLVIHASKGTKSVKRCHEVEAMFGRAGLPFPEGWPVRQQEYPLGRILAVGKLIDCAKMTPEMIARQSQMELAFGDWRPGRVVWIIASLRRVEHIPFKAKLGLWTVPPEIEARIAA